MSSALLPWYILLLPLFAAALIVLLTVGSVTLFTLRMTPVYAAKATVLVKGVPSTGSAGGVLPQPDLPTERGLILQSSDIVAKVGAPEVFETLPIRYFGVENQYFAVFLEPTPSAAKTRIDERTIATVVSQAFVARFFPNVDPLGKEIMIGGAPFRVVGVAKRIGTAFGHSQDNFINVPLTAFTKNFMARPQLAINVQAWSSDQMFELEDEVRALMRARRHVPYKEPDNFGINASDTIMSAWHDLTGTIFGATIGIVAVFMVVGGIVIMNIMLASVTERTHEIGIRKSLGARRRDVLWQFVIESGVMAATGGVIGILLAAIVSWVVNHFFTSSMPLSAILVGIALSTSVGLFFGIYPAWKAAQLDPIEALRTEN